MDHQALLRAVETCSCTVFIEWYENAQSQNNLAVKESVDRLSNKDLCSIWTVFIKWVMDITNSLKDRLPDSSENDSIMKNLLIMSTMATYTIQNMSTNEPQGLSPSLKTMNESLKLVTCKKTGGSICEMSEKYWKVHPELEISLSVNVISWLLGQALHPKATSVSVKHVYNLKQSIEKLNPMILKSSGMLDLFISGISNSKFISSNEAQKCIACLFTFGPSVVKELQKKIKEFIPLATISDCESLGEIYFKAWRLTVVEESRTDIEFSIQDLMCKAVSALRTPVGPVEGGLNKVPMNKLLFHLLHAIHRHRKQRTVAVFIHKLYKPILWRCFEASNGLVRANALCLFFDAFPFESGEGSEEDKAVRNKEWQTMLDALMDPVPLVRTIAIQGTSRILAEYWAIVPVNIIQDLITLLLRKLLYDSSSADVRANVVKGLVTMLESKQTHNLLEKMIPLTNKVLHDPNEKVRAEYVFLLTHVQKLKVSKLWEVIDVKHLIARLAMDSSTIVCRRLVVLLSPFYYPKSTPEIVFQRCLRLVIDNREASRKFYQHINNCVGVEQMAQLILIIWKFLRNHIHKQLQQNRNSQEREEMDRQNHSRVAKRSRRENQVESPSETSEDEDKENQDGSTDEDGVNDDSIEEFCESSIVGLIDVVCILLSGNKAKFKAPQNATFWDEIKSRFTKTCSLFFRYFKNSDGLRSLIYLYGLMSSTASTLLLSFVKSQLKSLSDNATCKEFGHLVDVLCNWSRGEDLLDFISDHFEERLALLVSDQSESSQVSKDNGKKRVSFERSNDDKSMLGLRCMIYILQHPYNKKIVLRKNLAQIENLCVSLKNVTMIIEKNPETLNNKDDFLFESASVYVRTILVLTCFYKRSKNGGLKYAESQEVILEILDWISRLMDSELNLIIGDLISSVVGSISNLVVIHSMNWEVHRQFLNIVLQLVMRFLSSNLTLAMNCAYNSLVFIWTERSIGNECDVHCDRQINLIIDYVLERPDSETEASENGEEVCLGENDWPILRNIFIKIFEQCHRVLTTIQNPEKHESIRAIVRKMGDTVRRDMAQYQQLENQGDVINLNQISKAIIAAFRARNVLAKMMLDDIFETLSTSTDEEEMVLPNLVVIAKLLEHMSKNKGSISESTFVHAIVSFEQRWSTVGEVEKKANADLVSLVNITVNDLKKAFSM